MTEPNRKPQRESYLPNRAGDVAFSREKLLHRVRELEDDLLRLCGPVCPHDGKYAVEHAPDRCQHSDRVETCNAPRHELIHHWHDGTYRGAWLYRMQPHDFEPTHPVWPEGEAWLRVRSR